MSDDNLEVFMVKEVAAMFRIQPNTVYARLHEWPHHRIGTLIRFSRADIEAIKEMTHRTPAPPVLRARPTRIGTERSKARNRAYNRRNGLTENPCPAKPRIPLLFE